MAYKTSNIYVSATGQKCHPDAPMGGGGSGGFMYCGVLGVHNFKYECIPHPSSPAARQFTPDAIRNGLIPGKIGYTIASSQHRPGDLPSSIVQSVTELSLKDRFIEVLRRTQKKLPENMRHEFEALLEPSNLKLIAGTFAFWAGSHAIGLGQSIDVFLLVIGGCYLGKAVFDVARQLNDVLVHTIYAENENDLDAAASNLAEVITTISIGTFLLLISKIAHKSGGKSKGVAAERQNESARFNFKERPSDLRQGLHNKNLDELDFSEFKASRQVNMTNLSVKDQIAAKTLEQQGWKENKILQILDSGNDFRLENMKKGDKVYGFSSSASPKNASKSAYWLDEAGYKDMESKFYRDGLWDKEGVKNYLALPCYNRADTINAAIVTQETTAVKSTVGKATELIQYKNNDGSGTELMKKAMSGGGTQVTVDPAKLKLLPLR